VSEVWELDEVVVGEDREVALISELDVDGDWNRVARGILVRSRVLGGGTLGLSVEASTIVIIWKLSKRLTSRDTENYSDRNRNEY